jgi:hypothetical protein
MILKFHSVWYNQEKMRNGEILMKKFILGLLVGVSLTAAGSVYADDIVESIVGKQVQGSFPITVDGKKLDTVAAVIDGTSYLPVRAIGEALNKEVTFDADMGIELKGKETATVADTPRIIIVPAQPDAESIQKQIAERKDAIEKSKTLIKANEGFLKVKPEETQKRIDELNAGIAANEATIAELEAQLAAQGAQ